CLALGDAVRSADSRDGERVAALRRIRAADGLGPFCEVGARVHVHRARRPGSGVAVRRDARLAAETDGDADPPADARRVARLDAEPEDELLPEHVVDRIDRAGQDLGEGAGQGDLAGAAAKLRVAAVRSGLGAWRA